MNGPRRFHRIREERTFLGPHLLEFRRGVNEQVHTRTSFQNSRQIVSETLYREPIRGGDDDDVDVAFRRGRPKGVGAKEPS